MSTEQFAPRSATTGITPPRPNFSNWGRWGDEDEAGAANHLTSEHVLGALGQATSGRVIHLGQVLGDKKAPRTGQPAQHFMQNDAGDYLAGAKAPKGFKGAADHVSLSIHGSTTHLDALGHVWYDDELYNGFDQNAVRSSGMRKLGIEKAPPFVTRGVLIDLPKLMNLEHLPAGHEVTADEIKAACEMDGIEIRAGDAVLIRTGWIRVWNDETTSYSGDRPGIGLDASEFLASCDVTIVGADNSGVEVIPWASGTVCPVHQFLIRDCGIYLLEFLDLEEAATANQAEFLFIAIPLRIRGGTGSPIAPIAVL